MALVRAPAPATRIATITMLGAGLFVGLIGGSLLAVPSTMMVTGCSGDVACLNQFFWVAVLPFAERGAGAVIGQIVHWRTHWISRLGRDRHRTERGRHPGRVAGRRLLAAHLSQFGSWAGV